MWSNSSELSFITNSCLLNKFSEPHTERINRKALREYSTPGYYLSITLLRTKSQKEKKIGQAKIALKDNATNTIATTFIGEQTKNNLRKCLCI